MNDAAPGDHDAEQTRRHLEGYLQSYPGLRGRVCRVLLLQLHQRGHVRIEDVYRRAQRAEEWNLPADPNRPASKLWAADERELINDIVVDLASRHFSPEEVDRIVWSAHRRDEAQSLETLARMPDVPLGLIAEKVSQYASLPAPAGDSHEPGTPEGTRVALIRRFISDRVDYISIAKRSLRIADINWMLERVVSTEQGSGWVGGKAAGMVLANAILRGADCGEVALPETVFVLTDAYEDFKRLNGLNELADHKYRDIEDIRVDFPAIREVFRNAEFPARIGDLLRIELNRWGPLPLIVRSSSLLEDSFGATFSGIYHSLFLPNQGPLEDRLRELCGAISEIYSGVFSPDAVSYRKRHDLIDHDERMGVMIQPVIGRRYGRFYLPSMAGVAFSRNDNRWSKRIRREDGMLRVVVGLGTHAVDRIGDSARMVPLKAPTIRPEGTPEEVIQASQRHADVIDLDPAHEGFRRVPVPEILEAMRGGGIADYVSVVEEDGRLSHPVATRITAPAERLCVTFERLLKRGEFPRRMHAIIKRLERAYRVPVDVEFAVDDAKLYILQCRPLGGSMATARTPIPRDVADEDKIFSADRYVNNGVLKDIRYLVLIDPRDYRGIDTVERRLELARAVGRLNDRLAGEIFILMGPGRWGSQDIRLGVQVTYADICNASALIEIARAQGDYTPEPSFGTHFFQDLVEANILYLPLYPDEPGVIFNEAFFERSPNALARLSERDAPLSGILRVVDLEEAAPGRTLRMALDGENQQALGYLH